MTDAVVWPTAQLGEAIEALARAAGLVTEGAAVPRVPVHVVERGGEALERWLDAVLRPLGLDAEATFTSYDEASALVAQAAPALMHLDGGFVLLLRLGRREVTVLDRHKTPVKVSVDALAERLAAPVAEPYGKAVDGLLEAASIAPGRRSRARRLLLARQVRHPVGRVWLLREAPGTDLWRQLKIHDLPRAAASMLLAHAGHYLLVLGAWAVIGVSALQGRLEAGWLLAWALLLLTTVPLVMSSTWLQGRFSIGVSALLKRRLLHGVLQLQPDEIRHEGVGRLLGKVIESEAFESLALGGGVLVVLSTVELLMALGVLLAGAGGGVHALLLLLWLALQVALGWRYYQRARMWARQRVDLTSDLVESMVGHRTRLAQLPRRRWHDGEDEALDRYLTLARRMDEALAQQAVLAPRGWMILAVLGLAPAFVEGGAGAGSLAVSLGGILLAQRALHKAGESLAQLGGAALAWEQMAGPYRAASRCEAGGCPVASMPLRPEEADGEPILDARDVHFAYASRGRAVLRGAHLRIDDGDKLLLEGGSGAGKSTFASLLVGLRKPTSGLMLLRGFDRATLGLAEWRRRIIAAPQFHENHVLSGSLAFNLLLGSRWPADPTDLERAEAVCRDLGLGPLLERMPGGIHQMVGETGWQLSHGERSRIFMARALLQDADLIVLDESFAALDPESLQRTLSCVLETAPTVMVIAHP